MAKQGPPEMEHKVLHATLMIGDSMLAGSDSLPGQYREPWGCQVLIGIDDLVKAKRMFNALAKKWNGANAVSEDFLVQGVRRGHRPVWHPLGNQWRAGCHLKGTLLWVALLFGLPRLKCFTASASANVAYYELAVAQLSGNRGD
jgi:hypothetical protein